MPVITHKDLPAIDILKKQNIVIMDESRALHQDIRPLQIAILNLMPLKIVTETQLLLLLSNSPIQLEITLLHPKSYVSKNTSEKHLLNFYKTFDEVKHRKFDGFIVTGAPIEQLEFEDVVYWDELKEILDYTRTNVTSTMHICWGAQAGLYHHYGIPKYPLKQKMFGVFEHKRLHRKNPLFRGFDDTFYVPHSRHTEIRKADIDRCPELTIEAISKESGVHIVTANNNRQIYITGHHEYDRNTLKAEFDRDMNKGLDIQVPKHYYPNDDPSKKPIVKWRAHANLWFHNWINFVYQETPFNIEEIK